MDEVAARRPAEVHHNVRRPPRVGLERIIPAAPGNARKAREFGLRLLLLQTTNAKQRIRSSKRRGLRRIAEVCHAVPGLAVEP